MRLEKPSSKFRISCVGLLGALLSCLTGFGCTDASPSENSKSVELKTEKAEASAKKPSSAAIAEHQPKTLENKAAFTEDVDALRAKKILDSGEALVLDVRTVQEFAQGHIPGALKSDIRSGDFEKKIASLDKEQPYLVHCAAGTPGGRSRKAVAALRAAGVKHVYHLNGGFVAWEKAEQAQKK